MRRAPTDELLEGFLAINAILREEFDALRRALKLRKTHKHNPNWHLQPRVPRGVAEGGQWTSGGSTAPTRRPNRALRTSPRQTPRRRPQRGVGRVPAPRATPGPGRQAWPLSWFRPSPLTMPLALYGDTPRPRITTRRVEGTDDLWLVNIHIPQTGAHLTSFQREVRPERRVPLVLFGVDTGVRTIEPATLERLNVDVELRDQEVWFDLAALAAAYGRDVFGANDAPHNPPPRVVPASPEERRLDFNLRQLHASPDEIAIAIQQLRNADADGDPFMRALRERGASPRYARRIRDLVRFQRATRPYTPPTNGPLVDMFPGLNTAQGGQSVFMRDAREIRAALTALGLPEDDIIAVNRTIQIANGSYRIPDLRIGDVYIDISVDVKDARTPQVISFFEARIPPTYVIIIRPRRLGEIADAQL